jgi:hypothetical protein
MPCFSFPGVEAVREALQRSTATTCAAATSQRIPKRDWFRDEKPPPHPNTFARSFPVPVEKGRTHCLHVKGYEPPPPPEKRKKAKSREAPNHTSRKDILSKDGMGVGMQCDGGSDIGKVKGCPRMSTDIMSKDVNGYIVKGCQRIYIYTVKFGCLCGSCCYRGGVLRWAEKGWPTLHLLNCDECSPTNS